MTDIALTKHKLELVAAAIDAGYNRDFLLRHFWPPVRSFIRQQYNLLHQTGVRTDLLDAGLANNSPTKATLINICAIPFSSKIAYDEYMKSLSEDVRTLWHALIWVDSMTQVEIERKLGFKIYSIEEKSYYRNGPVVKNLTKMDRFNLFVDASQEHFMWRSDFNLSLPIELRKLLVEYYEKPADALLTGVAEPQATKHLYINGEQNILTEMPRVLTYHEQGQIALTGKLRPAHTTLLKMQRSLSIKEFFPEHEDKKTRTLRTNMVASGIVFINTQNISPSTPDIVKSFIRYIYPDIRTVPALLPDLKGMGYIDEHYFLEKEATMFELLKQFPSGQWVPVHNIIQHVKYNLIDIKPIRKYIAREKLFYEYEGVGKYGYKENKHYIDDQSYPNAVEQPFLLGSFFFLASMGLCDLAYDEPDWENMGRNSFSSWDGLRYVRRNALGDYVCGHSITYEASAISDGKKITLSPDTLMIMTEETDVSAAAILEPYTERMGTNRFRTDSQIFLRNIKSKKDLEAKITLFKQVIGSEMPPNWAEFFKGLTQKINPFTSPGELFAYRIPLENKPLIQIIAQDPVLKSLVIKAEGYVILVEKGNHAAFKRRLQEFGYLLT